MLGHTKRGQLPPQCKELRWCLSSKKTFNCLDFIAGIVLRQILNRYYSSEKKKKTSVETINPYCFQICGLTSFAVASHSRLARGLERGHQISTAAPDSLGRFHLSRRSMCLSFISPPFSTQQGQIPHTGTPGSSHPWSWAHQVKLLEGDERLPVLGWASRIS